MGILNWLGFEQRSETPPEQPAPGTSVLPPSRTADFTVDSAMSLSSVYRAVFILGTAASQLTLDVWRGGDPVEPKPPLIRKPDVDNTLSGFLEATVVSMAVSGDAYWLLDRNARNEVVNARVLDPWACFEDTDKQELSYKDKTYSKDRYHHLRLMRVPGKSKGLGPIQAARAELRGAADLRDFSAGWFTSGDVPTGLLKTDQFLSPEQAREYREQWLAREAHSVAVMGNGLDYSPILLNPEDAQFIQVQQFSVTGIARLFGIPAHLLLAAVEGSSMTYTNVAQADLSFVRWTLMKYLREIEESFSVLLPGIQTARFNLDSLLRPDTKTRYEAHEIALRAKFLTPNEVRAMEGLAPITGGDKVTQAAPPPAPAQPPAPTQEEAP